MSAPEAQERQVVGVLTLTRICTLPRSSMTGIGFWRAPALPRPAWAIGRCWPDAFVRHVTPVSSRPAAMAPACSASCSRLGSRFWR